MESFRNCALVLSIVISVGQSYSQNPGDPGTLLKYSQYEVYYNVEQNLIEVGDLNDDLNNEIIILAIDTLIIIDSSSIHYIPAFNPQPTNIGAASLRYSDCTNKRIISVSQDFPTTHWSYYYPETNHFEYGNFQRYQQYYFAPDPNCNIWSVNSVDNDSFNLYGIFTSSEIFEEGTLITLLGENDSLFTYAGGIGFPTVIYVSKNSSFISTVLVRDNIFTSGNPHGIYHYYSTNQGNNWQGEIILRGNMDEPVWGQITNRNLAPHLKNYSMLSGALDSVGVMHMALWGLGKTIEGIDTIETSTILYWNSRDKNWIAITDPAYEKMYDGAGNPLGQYTPGFAYGQSLPTISVSENGQIVLIAWSVPEYTGEPGVSSLNIYPGDGGAFSTPVYYTDYLANISYDGGQTWSPDNIFPLKNRQNILETFLSLNKKINYDDITGKIRADYFYIVDEIPGLSYWGQNSPSDSNVWYYDSLVLFTTPVHNDLISVYDYSLSQNYPNPFNPVTKINYSLAHYGKITIKVFDILGREISTLINEEKPAGNHTVEFNASYLASGVYIYRLQSGDYISSKMLLLLK
ncbi:MAG: T9SS type A sorting domain-containing protein [Ignavibacterium sp.]|nr:T9SS type A sorting domain-containing protein [Ignavibacterium sp.]